MVLFKVGEIVRISDQYYQILEVEERHQDKIFGTFANRYRVVDLERIVIKNGVYMWVTEPYLQKVLAEDEEIIKILYEKG